MLIDEYSPNLLQPIADVNNGGTNDVLNVTGTEANGVTTFTFTRKINTGDGRDMVC